MPLFYEDMKYSAERRLLKLDEIVTVIVRESYEPDIATGYSPASQ